MNFIFLEESSIELEEIFVQSKVPIVIKKDTIIFNAASFSQGNEQVVEDLLKKIPGLTVSENGTIKIGNQEVEKVMIDGEDMFGKGYQILTKNMTANPVETVSLYQHYSNNKHLKGIENSDKVALNLTLKDNFKRDWFGNFSGGYGLVSENRYELKTNLMNFGKKNKYYFLSNFNNIGLDAVGDLNSLIRPPGIDEPASIGDNQNAFSIIGLEATGPNLKKERVNFNNAEMVSLNSIITLSEKVKLKILGLFNADENDFHRKGFQSFFLGATSFSNNENFYLRQKNKTCFAKADLIYDISKNKTLEYSGKFNSTIEKFESRIIFNAAPIFEKLKDNNELIDQKMVYTNRFKEDKVLLMTFRYISEKTPQNYAINSFFYQDLFDVESASKVMQSS